MRRLLLLALLATASGAGPATASAASEHLTPAGYAALDTLWKLTSAPDLSKVEGGLNAKLCGRLPLGDADPQARLVVDDCLAAMRMSGHVMAALDCGDDKTRCTVRALRRGAVAGREAAALQARLGRLVTGRCHRYFALDRRATLGIVHRTDRVVAAYASGDEDRIVPALKRWSKGLVRLAEPARLERSASLLRACDPAGY